MKEHKTTAQNHSIHEEPERYTTAADFPPEPKGVSSTIVDIIGSHILKQDRELFKRLEEYDREKRPEPE